MVPADAETLNSRSGSVSRRRRWRAGRAELAWFSRMIRAIVASSSTYGRARGGLEHLQLAPGNRDALALPDMQPPATFRTAGPANSDISIRTRMPFMRLVYRRRRGLAISPDRRVGARLFSGLRLAGR